MDEDARKFLANALTNYAGWPKIVGILIGIISGGGIAVFAVGYVIGTLSYAALRIFFSMRGRSGRRSRFHEVALSDDALQAVWKRLGAPGIPDRAMELSAGAAFDHGILREEYPGVHRWLFRRWNAVSIAVMSFCGLIRSLPFGWLIGSRITATWPLSVVLFLFILSYVGYSAWWDTMRMLEFSSMLPPKKPKPHQTGGKREWSNDSIVTRATKKEQAETSEDGRDRSDSSHEEDDDASDCRPDDTSRIISV